MIAQADSLHSCIYEGRVWHERLAEKPHQFRYRLFQMYLDLDELDAAFQGRWFWSHQRPALARFERRDHLGKPESSLKSAVRELILERTGCHSRGPIRLLTNLRYYGYVMNPVSFYYCFDDTDRRVEFTVAEVHNTPWGEQHSYVLSWPEDSSETAEFRCSKEFHVSPFMPMEMTYLWKLSVPGNSLNVQIENFQQDEKQFTAQLEMQRIPLSAWNLNTRLLRYPWMTGKVIAAIYWQALKLWWKGVTYYPHPHPKSPKELIP